MAGFITRRWLMNGRQVDEQTYPTDYRTVEQMKLATDLQFFGRLECHLVFDPPMIQLTGDEWRQLKALLDERAASDS